MGRFSNILSLFLGALGLFSLPLHASNQMQAETLVIAAASSLQNALNPIVEKFNSNSKIRAQVVYGSSGKLAAQIVNGAPFDLFLSADEEYPEKIAAAGKAKSELQVFAIGYLSLWIRDGVGAGANSDDLLSLLQSPKIRRIAVANPAVAPYGRAAMAYLDRAGVAEKIRPQLVFAESVSQTLQFVFSRNVDAAITARSIIPQNGDLFGGRWLPIPDAAYTPIPSAMVTLIRKNQSDRVSRAAQEFFQFMQSKEAVSILSENGYGATPRKSAL